MQKDIMQCLTAATRLLPFNLCLVDEAMLEVGMQRAADSRTPHLEVFASMVGCCRDAM